jgi:hypothetical protein
MILSSELKETFLKMLELEDETDSERLFEKLSTEQKALFIACYDQVSIEVQ